MIKSGDADAILVHRLDRLARDLVLQEILLREIHASGGALVSATPGENELLRDPHDPTRTLMRQMLGAFA
jgi:DNA invertase Pin-like site-specific DNA recombinase